MARSDDSFEGYTRANNMLEASRGLEVESQGYIFSILHCGGLQVLLIIFSM